MKRFGWILLVFAAFFFAPQEVSGLIVVDSGGGNLFQEAGEDLKMKCEKSLAAHALAAGKSFSEMPAGGYVTKFGMMPLEICIKDFDKTKEDCDSRLKLYGLRTETKLDTVYRKVVDVYFLRDEMDGRSPRNFFYGDSQSETIRRIFAERFGVDMKIWRGLNKSNEAAGVLIIFLLLFFVLPI